MEALVATVSWPSWRAACPADVDRPGEEERPGDGDRPGDAPDVWSAMAVQPPRRESVTSPARADRTMCTCLSCPAGVETTPRLGCGTDPRRAACQDGPGGLGDVRGQTAATCARPSPPAPS